MDGRRDASHVRLVVPATLAGGALLVASRRFRDWGATKGECAAYLPGDDFVADPADVTTQAVTIAAPADEVWRWLVQIGQDRGGMYSYDWVENLVGLNIHSTGEVRDEWQHLAVGDTVRLVPRGWLGMRDGLALPVARLDPGRSIVLRQQPPEMPWDAVWSFHIQPDGPRRCRLLSRSRAAHRCAISTLATSLMDPVVFLMTRRMLRGIRTRAEGAARTARPRELEVAP